MFGGNINNNFLSLFRVLLGDTVETPKMKVFC